MSKKLDDIKSFLGIPESEFKDEDEEIDAGKVTSSKTDVKPVEESEVKLQPLPEDPKEDDEIFKDDDDDKDPSPSNPLL